jgi:hypothetical protein
VSDPGGFLLRFGRNAARIGMRTKSLWIDNLTKPFEHSIKSKGHESQVEKVNDF